MVAREAKWLDVMNVQGPAVLRRRLSTIPTIAISLSNLDLGALPSGSVVQDASAAPATVPRPTQVKPVVGSRGARSCAVLAPRMSAGRNQDCSHASWAFERPSRHLGAEEVVAAFAAPSFLSGIELAGAVLALHGTRVKLSYDNQPLGAADCHVGAPDRPRSGDLHLDRVASTPCCSTGAWEDSVQRR